MEQNKILLFIKIPPPITGATLMNKRVRDSVILNENFNLRSICISYKKDLSETGSYTMKKIILIILVILRLLKELLFYRPSFVYYQISPVGVAFLRDLCFVIIIKIFRTKIVYHIRGQGIEEQSKVKWKKKLYEYAFHNSEIICLSKLLTYDIKNVFNGIIHIVNNGIPDADNIFISGTQKKNNKEIIILYLSNLSESKGIFEFIDALSLIDKKRYKFQVKIVGSDGTFSYNDLLDIIRNKNLQNKIVYVGPKYGTDKHKILAQSDILVFPTRNDAFPGVLLEALQFSLPIISTKEGAIPEIVDEGITGFLVDKNRPDQIADKLDVLIKSPELRKQMGEAGRKKYLQRYTLEKFERNMKNVFEDILSRQ